MKPGQEACLRMAEYQHGCRNQRLMWQWLFTWAAWSDDADFFTDPRMPVFKPRNSKKKWKHLTNNETKAIIKQIPSWSTDHLNTYIFKMMVEDKLKEKNT
jgi:hypothetical protein